MPSKPCLGCARSTPIFADGRCAPCHVKLVAEGSLPAESTMPRRCPVEGCDGYVAKKGLCDRHYRRVLDHGTTAKVRREGAAPERSHPHYKNWLFLRSHGKLCSEWRDFQAFWSDVGDRPSARHRLARPDTTQPYSPTNFFWRKPLLPVVHATGKSPEARAAYCREYQRLTRAHTPQYWSASQRKRNYGVTVDQFEAMLDAQDGRCAICRKAETKRRKNGSLLPLSVDHDHATGAVRALLCGACNAMLGYAEDSPDRLVEAAAYLARYARPAELKECA